MSTIEGNSFLLKNIQYNVKVLLPEDMKSLLFIKNNREVHSERFQLQEQNNACYLGAVINNHVVGFVLVSFQNKKDVQSYTKWQICADMIDLFVIEPLRSFGIGRTLIYFAERVCIERSIQYLGLDVNPKDNPRAMKLYSSLGYNVVGDLHLDGVYRSVDEIGNQTRYEDWCFDMIKELKS